MLLDTSGLLCLHSRSEALHTEACEWFDAATTRVTHNYVLAEFVALAESRGVPRLGVLEFLDALRASPEIELIWIDPATHLEAELLLKARLDKTYSLCDAASFVLMNRRGIREALTTDRHFEQEGFCRLLITPA